LKPYLLCLVILGIYNYLRFDNLFEFGSKYQLSVFNNDKMVFFNVNNFIPGLYFYLFHPLLINPQFPFVHIVTHWPFNTNPPENYYLEKITGIFPANPYLLLLLIIPLMVIVRKDFIFNEIKKREKDFPVFEFLVIIVPALLICMFLVMWFSVNMRYLIDFITLLTLASTIVGFYMYKKLINSNEVFIFKLVFIVISFLSISFGAAYGIEGCEYGPEYGLQGYRPEEFKKLEEFFSPISRLIYNVSKGKSVCY
jgi:hypothetical protein